LRRIDRSAAFDDLNSGQHGITVQDLHACAPALQAEISAVGKAPRRKERSNRAFDPASSWMTTRTSLNNEGRVDPKSEYQTHT
jgi:hypothetical protein